MFHGLPTHDGKYLLLHKVNGHNYTIDYAEISLPIQKGIKFKPMMPQVRQEFDYINNYGKQFFFKTNYKTERGRIIEVDLDKLDEKYWKTIVPEH